MTLADCIRVLLESIRVGPNDANHGRGDGGQETARLQNGQRSLRVESFRIAAQTATAVRLDLQK